MEVPEAHTYAPAHGSRKANSDFASLAPFEVATNQLTGRGTSLQLVKPKPAAHS